MKFDVNYENSNKKIYYKVQDIIKNEKIKKYSNECNEIYNEGLTFLGIFTGKNTLQLEKLRNLKLKIELLQTSKIEKKDLYDPKDIMAEIYASTIVDFAGKFTTEMKEVYDEIKINYKEDIQDEVYILANKKIENSKQYLPIIYEQKSNKIFKKIKTQIKYLRIENMNLQNKLNLQKNRKINNIIWKDLTNE